MPAKCGLGGWYIFDYDENLVFDEHPETLWKRLIGKTELQKVMFPYRAGMISRWLVLDPIARQFLDILAAGPGPALHELPRRTARAMAAGMSAAFPDTFEAPPVEIEHRVIPGGPNGDLTIRVVREPPARTDPLPAVMYFHGGGWVVCDFQHAQPPGARRAVGAGAAVVFVEYSLSPEVRFPVANEEAYFATKYVAENGPALNIDPSRIAVAGDSAGANMATVVSLLAKARAAGRRSFERGSGRSRSPTPISRQRRCNEFADGYFLTRDSMKWFWDNYLPQPEARQHPHVAPLHASVDELRGLPPAFVMTCEFDVLRDEGEAYARKLVDAGVRVTSTRSAGTIHGCLTLGPLANTPAVRTAITAAKAHLRKNLVG